MKISIKSAPVILGLMLAIVFLGLQPVAAQITFQHPGVLVSRAQLDFIKAQVNAKIDPFYTEFQWAVASPLASLTYQVQGPYAGGVNQCGSNSSPDNGCKTGDSDASAAYLQAVLWYITGNQTYANNSIKIMNAYSRNLKGFAGFTTGIPCPGASTACSNGPLQAAWDTEKWPRAAEIIRYSNAGWADADIQAFSSMLANIYEPLIYNGSGSNGNWELSMIEGMMGIAVFNEDAALFQHAQDFWHQRVPAYFYYYPIDGNAPAPFPVRPANSTTWNGQTIFDARVNGLAQETCRDFKHTEYGISATMAAAETAHIQGVNLFESEQPRLIAALEFSSYYEYLNSKTVPSYICGGSVTLASGSTYVIGYNEYHNRLGQSLPNTAQWIKSGVLTNSSPTDFSSGPHMTVFEPLTHYADAGNASTTVLTFSGAPANAQAGIPQSITVLATVSPTTAPAYTGTVHFSSSDSAAVLPADYTYTAADAGSHTFTGIVFKAAATETLTVTDTSQNTLAATASTVVGAGPSSTVRVLSGGGQIANVGSVFPLPLKISVADAFQNAVNNASVMFTAPATGASAVFAGNAPTAVAITDATGTATSPALTANATVGTYSVVASTGTATSASFLLTNQYTTTLTLSVTPGAAATYGQSITLTATINPATLSGIVPTGTITFFDGSTQIASQNVAGAAASATIASPSAGSHSYTAVYSGDANVSGSNSAASALTVTKATPTITWAAPAAIGYGTAISASQLNASGAGIAGTFVYTPAAGTMLSAGANQPLSVTFTPADATNYNIATGSTTITVNKAALTVTPNPASRAYGAANPAFTGTISGLVAGDNITATYSSSASVSTAVGSYSSGSNAISAILIDPFVKLGNYSVTQNLGTLTITRAPTALAWTAPAAITYGTALSATQLNATSGGVAGTFVYTPASGSILGAGTQTLSVAFAPTDTANYSATTATTTIAVNKAALTVTAGDASRFTGAANPAFTFSMAGFLNGDTQTSAVTGSPALATTATATSTAGSYPITPTVGSLASANYSFAFVNGTLTVNTAPNPVPVFSTMSPAYATAGAAGFTLTVNGTGFTASSTIQWGASALTTQFVSATQLTAQVPASAIATAGTPSVTVQTPTPGGGASNAMQFQIDSAGSSAATAPTFATQTVAVAAGSTATYPVTLPANSTSVSVTCLNLPAGASCSYSTTSGSVTITTSSTTPKGTYQVTVVVHETLPGAAAAGGLLPVFLLTLIFRRKKLARHRTWLNVCLGVVILAAMAASVGCGGGSTVSPPTTTHQVTSSGSVSLTVQ